MATIDDVATQLAAHDRIMQDRYEHLEKGIGEIKSAESAEGKDMAGTVNVESSPLGGLLPLMMGGGNWGGSGTAGAVGGGLGAGVLGGVLGGALLGNRRGGLLGGDGDGVGGNFVTSAELTAGLNGVTSSANTNSIMQGIGDLKTGVAGIPTAVALAEGQVQLALQGAQAQLTSSIDSTGDQILTQANAAQISNLQGQAAISRQLSDVIATSLASQSTIKDTVQDTAAATNLAIANLATAGLQNTYALNTAIRDASDKAVAATTAQGLETRALINSLNTHNLERSLSDANNKVNMLELAAQNSGIRSQVRETEINISNNNNAIASANANASAIASIVQTLNQIVPVLNGLQHATAQTTQIIAGNRGYAQGGNQSAVPTNVMA